LPCDRTWSSRLKQARLLPWLLALAVLAAAIGATGASAARPLADRLAAALQVEGLDPTLTGALVVDTQTGKVVFSRNARRSLVPASTEKLTVALTALTVLGPEFRARTLLLGRGKQRGTVWKGHLVLKGFGDPSLHRNDLESLARQLASTGIKTVSGSVIGDESYFDASRTAPGWRASFYKLWSPPLSALIVDRAVSHGIVVDKPALAAARALKTELKNAGVKVRRRAKSGVVNESRATELGFVESPTVAELVTFMNSESDNFTAETLLKMIGAEVRGEGTTLAGATVVKRVLREAGVPIAGVRIADGSGLSKLDRLTPRSVVGLIGAARENRSLWPHFRGSLAVAGRTGTLEDRLRTKPSRGAVRAKTGTTNLSSALSGIVRDRYIFSVIMNGTSVPYWRARPAQDRFATILARESRRPPPAP